MLALTPSAEDYLEHLYMREVEGAAAPFTQPDDRVVGELLRHGFLRQQDGGLSLTDKGSQEAVRTVRRHRLAERLLHDVIAVHGTQVDKAACEFEHSLHHGVDEQICTLLGHPKTCPHGRPIPAGRCCRKRAGAAGPAVAPLAELKKSERGTIAYLSSRQQHTVQKLMALGALPGSPISVIQTFPSIVFQINQTQVAVDKELAGDIYVRRIVEE
ncbi:MAG: metal-dependent transcriptional regulator [Armatimonadota bacterium]